MNDIAISYIVVGSVFSLLCICVTVVIIYGLLLRHRERIAYIQKTGTMPTVNHPYKFNSEPTWRIN